MPYRRLPNTDSARIKALKKANSKGKDLPPFKLAYSQSTFQRVQMFLPTFEQTITLQKHAYSTQAKNNRDYQQKMKKAKLYISHFIQVLNLSVIREEMPSSAKNFFNLPKDNKKVPPLNTEEDIIKWGENLIAGENKRKQMGKAPITNPTIALVKVRYEAFIEAHNYQKTLKKNTARSQEKLVDLRKEADDIILNIWNEVEDSFKDLPDEVRREKAKDYGLIYVYRKNEIGKINFYNIQSNIG